MRTKRIFLTAIVAIGIGVTGASLASAQSYPDRLIKIVVPYPPGGPADVAARLVTQPLSTKLGQSVIVENQSGGGGRTGAKFVALQSNNHVLLEQDPATQRFFEEVSLFLAK